MGPLPGNKFGAQVCEALGLDPKKVRDIYIEICTGDIARVSVESYLDANNAGELLTVLKEYTVVSREE